MFFVFTSNSQWKKPNKTNNNKYLLTILSQAFSAQDCSESEFIFYKIRLNSSFNLMMNVELRWTGSIKYAQDILRTKTERNENKGENITCTYYARLRTDKMLQVQKCKFLELRIRTLYEICDIFVHWKALESYQLKFSKRKS